MPVCIVPSRRRLRAKPPACSSSTRETWRSSRLNTMQTKKGEKWLRDTVGMAWYPFLLPTKCFNIIDDEERRFGSIMRRTSAWAKQHRAWLGANLPFVIYHPKTWGIAVLAILRLFRKPFLIFVVLSYRHRHCSVSLADAWNILFFLPYSFHRCRVFVRPDR